MSSILTDVGRGLVTLALAVGAYLEPKYTGWGTGAGTALVTDTTLFAEKAADLVTATGTRGLGVTSRVTTTKTNDTWQCVQTLTATGAGNVTNSAVFDVAAIASGNMFIKGDYTAIPLALGDAIQLTHKVQFT